MLVNGKPDFLRRERPLHFKKKKKTLNQPTNLNRSGLGSEVWGLRGIGIHGQPTSSRLTFCAARLDVSATRLN